MRALLDADVMRHSGSMYCEAPVCDWIETPANAHSSWAYVLVGVLVLLSVRASPRGGIDTRAIGAIAIWLGFGSFFMHASLTFVGQVADLMGMFLIAGWAVGQNLLRIGWVSSDRARVVVSTVLVVGSLVTMLLLGHGFPAVVTVGAVALLIELQLAWRRAVPTGGYRPFFFAFGCLALSFVFWGLDLAKVGCEPDDHLLQGHAAWHLLNAPLFWFLHRFYAALPAPSAGATTEIATT
jgi:hypothetical protein